MTLLAIDPGPAVSAFVELIDYEPVLFGRYANVELLAMLRAPALTFPHVDELVIEKVESFGMAVGAEVFETVLVTGRFVEIGERNRWAVSRLGRKAVKLALCQSPKAKDPNIRQALVDRYTTDDQPAIGLKRSPGPLFGISADVWSALAVGVAWRDGAR